jgi:LmbE family N-acetylglucosaminyl deacetylase
MSSQHWIFLSPHYDDVALSCGGLVWDLARQGGSVEIWTVMGGLPPDEEYSDFARQNHHAWGMSGKEAILERRNEDIAACKVLGAQQRYFDWPDSIYRRDPNTGETVVKNNDELMGKPPESSLVAEIAMMLDAEIPQDAFLVCPMGLGDHIDHRAVFQACESLTRVDFHYADYPYILKTFDSPDFLAGTWKKVPRFLDQDALHAWEDAILCYTSQLSGIWQDVGDVQPTLRHYMAGGGGRLWQRKTPD